MDGIWVHTTPYGSFVMESRWVYDLLTYDLYFQEHLLGSYFQRKSAIQSVMDGSHDAKIGFPGHEAELPDYVTLWCNTLEEPFTETQAFNTPA